MYTEAYLSVPLQSLPVVKWFVDPAGPAILPCESRDRFQEPSSGFTPAFNPSVSFLRFFRVRSISEAAVDTQGCAASVAHSAFKLS